MPCWQQNQHGIRPAPTWPTTIVGQWGGEGVLSLALAAYLAGEDVSECGEGVVQGLVVDGLVQVLDEDVADAALPQRGVPL